MRPGIFGPGSVQAWPVVVGVLVLVGTGAGGSLAWPVPGGKPACEAVVRPGSYLPGHTACRMDARIMLAKEDQGGIRIHIRAKTGQAGLVRGGRCDVVCKDRTILGWEEAGGRRSLFFTYVECTTLSDRCLGKGLRGIKSTEVRYYPLVDLPNGRWGTCAGNPGGPGSLLFLVLRASRVTYELRAFSPEPPGVKTSAGISRCHGLAPAEEIARRKAATTRSGGRELRGQIPQGVVRQMPRSPSVREQMGQVRARRMAQDARHKRQRARQRRLLLGQRGEWGPDPEDGPSCHEVSSLVSFEVVPFNPFSYCPDTDEAAGVQITNPGPKRIACLAWPEQDPSDWGLVLIDPGETRTPSRGELFWCGQGRVLRGCCHLATDTDPLCCVPHRRQPDRRAH